VVLIDAFFPMTAIPVQAIDSDLALGYLLSDSNANNDVLNLATRTSPKLSATVDRRAHEVTARQNDLMPGSEESLPLLHKSIQSCCQIL